MLGGGCQKLKSAFRHFRSGAEANFLDQRQSVSIEYVFHKESWESDISRVNQKVYEFNQLLFDKFSNSDFVSIIDTVPLERRYFYKDGIHLSDCGLVKVSGILLSNLYGRVAPNLKRKKRKSSKNNQTIKSHT